MKGIVLVMDGMGDRPLKEFDNQTPLQAANTPNMDEMAKNGITGIMDSIAPGIIPGSDTAHLSILGYDPYEVYTGRGPLKQLVLEWMLFLEILHSDVISQQLMKMV